MSNMFQFKSAILYYGIQSIFGPNFSYLEYLIHASACIKYSDVNLKHFREEKDLPREIFKNVFT